MMQRHADFVLCDKDTLAPQAIVQIDDPGRGARHRANRKRLFRETCDAAGMRLILVSPAQTANPDAVADAVSAAL